MIAERGRASAYGIRVANWLTETPHEYVGRGAPGCAAESMSSQSGELGSAATAPTIRRGRAPAMVVTGRFALYP